MTDTFPLRTLRRSGIYASAGAILQHDVSHDTIYNAMYAFENRPLYQLNFSLEVKVTH